MAAACGTVGLNNELARPGTGTGEEMPDLDRVATHYARENLIEAITAGLKKQGVTPDTVGVDDLAPVD